MVILMLGSGPTVTVCTDWQRAPFDRIVAINNAWRVRPDWDDLIHPWDFPRDRMPPRIRPRQRIITEAEFVPAQNAYGGFVYAGATMAFTAAYWALHRHRPRVIAFLGCDMHYPGGQTHFYGKGTADPLRPDITLQSLESKSARLEVHAARQGCALINLSKGPTRLTFPRLRRDAIASATPRRFDPVAARHAERREARLGYIVPSGRYWREIDRFDPQELAVVDDLWQAALPLAGAA